MAVGWGGAVKNHFCDLTHCIEFSTENELSTDFKLLHLLSFCTILYLRIDNSGKIRWQVISLLGTLDHCFII